ncbi:metallophosphoesterase [Halobacteriales archaeon SW_7_68_16]|nr:MAG: metallophosphoesterase [Halobacteriales archaeon SW_7_68_16]
MEIGVISDVHGNRVALDAVLADMPDMDAMVCAGDVVGYNPWPAECVRALRGRDVPTVMGNHDRAATVDSARGFNGMARAGVRHAKEQLDDIERGWVAGLPTDRTEFDGRMKIVHGHPDNPDRYTYPDEFDADMLGGEDVLVMGHTHVQAHRVFADGIVMNPGSVGQPRDGDPRAAYAVVDLDAMSVTEYRVEYDIEAVAEAGLPENIGTRLREGR